MFFVLLAIGSILVAFSVFLLVKGQQYDFMLEELDPSDFPLKTIYSIGLAAQDYGFFSLRGSLKDDLTKQIKLYYPLKYCEYYTKIIWAQVLSFPLLIIPLFIVIACFFRQLFFLIIGLVFGLFCAYYFFSSVGNKVTARRDECEKEFSNAISKLALIVNSGVILHDAWANVAYGKEGDFYTLMQYSCEDMNNGMSDIDAIRKFGVMSDSEDIKKFTSALIQSIERGGGELPQFLSSQSYELWATKRQLMLQKGEKAAGALLMPIALMFVGVMFIVIVAAVQSFGI